MRRSAGRNRRLPRISAFGASIVVVTLWLLMPRPASEAWADSAAGGLDPTFGRGGKLTIDIRGGLTDSASAVAVQPDGKIVLAGTTRETWEFVVSRLNAEGSLDTSFGGVGKVSTKVGSGQSEALGVVLQPDGKIVAAGYAGTFADSNEKNFAIVRYNREGRLDASFGDNGVVAVDFDPIPGRSSQGNSLALQPDGKILVGGYVFSDAWDFALARLNPNGSLDGSLDGDGKITTSFGSNRSDLAYAVALQPDGKIVLAGYTNEYFCQGDCHDPTRFALARYNRDGSLDSSFGTDGKSVTAEGHDTRAAVLQPDGKIVVAGYALVNDYHDSEFVLARHNTNGSLDTGFGRDGRTNTSFGEAEASAMALQSDGKLVAVGSLRRRSYAMGNIPDDDLAVARLNPNGGLDPSFGRGGQITTDFASESLDRGNAVALQPDGKILVAGMSSRPTENCFDCGGDFAVARYYGAGSLSAAQAGPGKPSRPSGGRRTSSSSLSGSPTPAVGFQAANDTEPTKTQGTASRARGRSADSSAVEFWGLGLLVAVGGAAAALWYRRANARGH
jgi:uncharacterized delta-60 repeat protein